MRRISNAELADLPERWDNSRVDTSKYKQCCMKAWEVDKATYDKAKDEGCLCQVWHDKYFIGG